MRGRGWARGEGSRIEGGGRFSDHPGGVACMADGLRAGEASAGEGGEARRGGEVGIGGGGVGEMGHEGLGGRPRDVAVAGRAQ